MRIPNAGQDLVERRIVREGKRLAAAMLAGHVDAPDYSVMGLVRKLTLRWQQGMAALRGYSRSH